MNICFHVLGRSLSMGWLNHIVVIFLHFQDIGRLFSKVAVLFCIPTSHMRVLVPSHPYQHLVELDFLIFAILIMCSSILWL